MRTGSTASPSARTWARSRSSPLTWATTIARSSANRSVRRSRLRDRSLVSGDGHGDAGRHCGLPGVARAGPARHTQGYRAFASTVAPVSARSAQGSWSRRLARAAQIPCSNSPTTTPRKPSHPRGETVCPRTRTPSAVAVTGSASPRVAAVAGAGAAGRGRRGCSRPPWWPARDRERRGHRCRSSPPDPRRANGRTTMLPSRKVEAHTPMASTPDSRSDFAATV